MQWDYPQPFTEQIKVSASDIDGMGHTNNACYVIWCERAAWLHSRKLGLSVEDYRRLDRGVAIRQASYEYFLPSFAGDELTMATWLTHCDGKLRLERRFQLINPGNGVTLLRGHWTLIGICVSTGKPARFPEEFIRVYGGAITAGDSA